VAALDQLAGGEWFEIRERLHRPEQLFEFFSSGDRPAARVAALTEACSAAASGLDAAIEGGIFEFRRAELGAILSELAEAEYSSEVFSRLGVMEARAAALILATACQRALLTQDLPFLDDSDDGTEQSSAETVAAEQDLNQIIADVKEIIQTDPAVKMNAAIKNILLQLQKYREESATYRKLKEQATSYRLEMYSRTFAATFNQIFDSIRKNYAMFLEEQEEARRRGRPSVVQGLDTRSWTRLLTEHLEEVSWARSTLVFALREHTGVREPLVRLSRRRDDLLKRITAEEEVAADVAGGEAAAHRLSRLIARDTATRLRRWASQVASS